MRELALHIAERLLFTPYLWAGNDPMAGFDCSGFVIEVLKSVGKLPRDGDWTAATLATMFPIAELTQPGCLIFWSVGGKVIHVEMIYRTNPLLTIGASGGGSKTDNLQAAIDQDAYIKIRPARSTWALINDPFS